MALISMRQLLDYAAEHQFVCRPLTSIISSKLAPLWRLLLTAMRPSSCKPVPVREYAGAPFLRAMMDAAATEFPDVPIVVHQDHGTSPSVCQRSIQLGFTLGDDGWVVGYGRKDPHGL